MTVKYFPSVTNTATIHFDDYSTCYYDTENNQFEFLTTKQIKAMKKRFGNMNKFEIYVQNEIKACYDSWLNGRL